MNIKKIAGATAAFVASIGIAASAASAAPGSATFDQTYPVASQLCVKASAGTLGKRLEAKQSQVIAACNTLQTPFALAAQTFQNAKAADKAKVDAVCPAANAAGRPACRAARNSAKLANAAARLTQREAFQTYRNAIQTNRQTFWSTISSLRSAS
jgi:hypothetical protein